VGKDGDLRGLRDNAAGEASPQQSTPLCIAMERSMMTQEDDRTVPPASQEVPDLIQ
jgi:hypothetical protein